MSTKRTAALMALVQLEATHPEDRGQGICRTCCLPIWDEGGQIGHRSIDDGWSDRSKRGGDSLVCFSAIDYRHIPLEGREAAIYDGCLRAVRNIISDAS